ncbi:MAG TPA: ATP-binding protein [Negativicutes bacterium]|nr:ATP-binding protein [Negativicutes bacterium]
MHPILKESVFRRHLFTALFIVAVTVVAGGWARLSPSPGWFFAAIFAFSLLGARFFARTARRRYLCGAVALSAVLAGQAFCPLDFVGIRHVIFNAPFISAYVFPSVWPGVIISLVFSSLLAQAAINAGVPFAAFWEMLVGITLLPLLVHSVAHLLRRLFDERQELRSTNRELQNEIAERNKIEKELYASAEELSRKNSELTAALHTIERTQKQLLRQEKMASIGHLAAGIAHEINNPLVYVTTNVEILDRYFAAFDSVLAQYRQLRTKLEAIENTPLKDEADLVAKREQEYSLEHILADFPVLFADTVRGLQRINAIIRGMRHFSHVDRQGAFRRYDLNESIENTLLVAHNQIKQYAEVERSLGSLPPVEAVRGEIDQVLLNLLVNAAQAIGARRKAERGVIRIATWCDDDAVYCAIEDNGVGISGQHLSSIFDPFFTTKPVGQGTGLGLSISYDIIVDHHQGELSVESVEGQGAKFTVRLPIKHQRETDSETSD